VGEERLSARPGDGETGGTDAQPGLAQSGRQLVYLAAERTLLTWVRAAVALIVLGFAVDRFGLLLSPGEPPPVHAFVWSSWLGLALVATGVVVSVVSAVRYRRFAVRYARGDLRLGSGIPLGVALCSLLALAGAVLVVCLWWVSS